jgi:thiol reductant ABC exporter CydC subunit
MGAATIASSIGLLTTSAFIIAMAALHPSIAVLQVPIVGVRFFGIARGLFRYLERYTSHQVTFRLLARLRVTFYRALEPLAPARLMDYHSGDLLSRVIGDIEALENFYVRGLAPPLIAAIIMLGMTLFMASFAPALGWALLFFLLAAGVGLPALSRTIGRRTGQRLVEQRAALNAALVDGIQGLPDLLAFNQEQHQIDKIDVLGLELGALQQRMASLNGLQAALSSMLTGLALITTLVIAIPLVNNGAIEGVFIAVLALATLTSFEAVQPLPLAAQYLEKDLSAARRLFEIIEAEPEVAEPAQPLAPPTEFSLEIRDLCFSYPQIPEAFSLDGVSFHLPQGKRLAIVGASGAGKTTLLNLLLRFWDFEKGQILLGGQDIRHYSPEELRARIAVVPQNAYLFSASVRENLLIARPDASQEQLIAAAKQAQIHDFIQSLPQGYDTWIGDQGLRLSAGERQRLAIARAILRESPLLILDEPTANLDPLTEREVLRALDFIMQERTVLMITHRLVCVAPLTGKMDEILVLSQGKVIERGRHTDLLQMDGYYRKMWDLDSRID